MEKWRPVVGYEGYYEVSDVGNVRSVDRIVTRNDGVVHHLKSKNKKLRVNQDGYLTVKLSKDGEDDCKYVHRLVADAFIDNPDCLSEVDHIDDNRQNNIVGNLRWISREDNVSKIFQNKHHYTQTHNLFGDANPNFGNTALSKYYKAHKEEAIVKQGRPGIQNGRATKVAMYDENGCFVKEFPYIRACAQELVEMGARGNVDNVASNISKAIKNKKLYYKHCFVIE